MSDEYVTYMGHQWLTIEGDVVTVGVLEEALADLEDFTKADLPNENDPVEKDEICGELETSDGNLNIYAPVEGTVLEVNAAVAANPELIREDPFGEGWVLKIEAANQGE